MSTPPSPRNDAEPEITRDSSEVIDRAFFYHPMVLTSEAMDFGVAAKIVVGHALGQRIASARFSHGIGRLHTRIDVTSGDTAYNRAVTIAAGAIAYNAYLRHAEARWNDKTSIAAKPLHDLHMNYLAHLSGAHGQWNELRAYDPRVPGDLETNAEATEIMSDGRVLKGAILLSGFMLETGALNTEQITEVLTAKYIGESVPVLPDRAERGAGSKPMGADTLSPSPPEPPEIPPGPRVGAAVAAARGPLAAARPADIWLPPHHRGTGPSPDAPRTRR